MKECFSKTNAEFAAEFKYTFGTAEGRKGFALGIALRIALLTYMILCMLGIGKFMMYVNPPATGSFVIALLIIGVGIILILTSMVYIVSVYDYCNQKNILKIDQPSASEATE